MTSTPQLPSPLTTSTVSRITGAPFQATKTWIQYGYITRPPKHGPCFHFAAENVMEVVIMKTLCFDMGVRAKVAARVVEMGVAPRALEHCRDGKPTEIFIIFTDRGLQGVSIGGKRDWASPDRVRGTVMLPMGRIWGEMMGRANPHA